MRGVFVVSFILFSVQLFPQAGRSAQGLYEQGQSAMAEEDWYQAAEDFLECLKLNPAHREASHALAESYYELGEYDQALNWARKARQLARLNIETQNLEAFILAALGRFDEAGAIVKDVLARQPYNREALFVAAELDIAQGRSGDAAARYKNAVRLYPDDRRLLLSLALVLGSLGEWAQAASYIERAQIEHPEDFRVFYYSAYLEARAEKITQAIRDAERALLLKGDFAPARKLLGSLRYRNGDFAEALRLADEAINARRADISAWFLKGMALVRLGREGDARTTLEQALAIDPNDEFVRAAFEKLLIAGTAPEDSRRKKWADYHFTRAVSYKARFQSEQALFEYRRALRINPYADERAAYAELLKQQGSRELYLEELLFLQDMGKGTRAVNDALETYNALLSGSLKRVWNVKLEERKRHWHIAVFSAASQSAFFHTAASSVAAAYLKDILSHDRNISVMNLETHQASFSAAFRNAREAADWDGARCDYFMIISTAENERELSLKAELYVTRTGAKAAEWSIARAGQDRLRNASLSLVQQLDAALPFRAALLRREADTGLIDKGRLDGVKADSVAAGDSEAGAVYDIVRKGRLELKSDALGYKYQPSDIAGSFSVRQLDEEVSVGTLTRRGFFDTIAVGDEIILQAPPEGATGTGAEAARTQKTEPSADPELRALLLQLR
ncbi:MAG: tetratricopeptide repeat protein [Spirochaetaceae bacterium]|nr:tetratricopeptide repeat protein [Spirochaetaceae bacterium]